MAPWEQNLNNILIRHISQTIKEIMMKYFVTLVITAVLLIPGKLFSQEGKQINISSNKLELSLDTKFPRIIKYQWKETGSYFYGSNSTAKELLINGKTYSPDLVAFSTQGNPALYTLGISELNLLIKLKIEVLDDVVDFRVTEIQENGRFRLKTLAFPSHQLLTVNSKQENASFAGSRMFTAVKGTKGDHFIAADTASTDNIPLGFLYGFVSANGLSAGIWTNAVQEKNDDKRILKQSYSEDNIVYTSIWSGSWIYRAERIDYTSELPHIKIVITPDRNGDGTADWQDGAIAYRKIMNNPLGSKRVKDWVVFRIPMNFASQATQPFLKTLDETKRMYLNTDGLGQYVIHKGYGGEGHDSNHPDYGYIGKRQGGKENFQFLCEEAEKYNADIGVHINGTESYPEARQFSEDLVYKDKRGWDWLDPSFYIDKRNDAIDEKRYTRLKSLKDQIPGLDFIYLDVWYAKGSWDSRKIADEINSLGLILATEFPQDHEYNAVWNHWAVDYNYGGTKTKGFHSQIARFIRNHQKDTWIAKHPLLGGAEMADFEGWQGRVNYDKCINFTFDKNLPTKYLQHFPIIKWEKESVKFEGGVISTLENSVRVISRNEKVVLRDDSYLLPWSPIDETKLYHWNTKGGSSSWELPSSWSEASSVFLYSLSDQGKKLLSELIVENGKVNIKAKAAQPYVIYKEKQEDTAMLWGEGSIIANGAFNSGNTNKWKVEGKGAEIKRNPRGQYELIIGKSKGTEVSQNTPSLPLGKYCAEVYVQTSNKRKASLEIKTAGETYSNYTDASLWKNHILADSKNNTFMQRMFVFFEVKDHHEDVLFKLKAEKGDSPVIFDYARIIPANHSINHDSLYFKEDFEEIPAGIYPFVKGPGGGTNDPRMHLAEKHSPYTQKGWNGNLTDDVLSGNWSLKFHEHAQGILVQTLPQNLRFIAGKKYRVSFSYQSEKDLDYAFVLGEGNKTVFESSFNLQHETRTFEFEFTASQSGNSWFGIKKNMKGKSDFILDDIIVEELKAL